MSKPALMNVALIAARLGSRELEFAAKKVHAMKVSKKGPTDYVSEADRKIEQLVFEEIKKFYPEHNFLGEEFGHEINNSNITWILDPIDGTTNFIHGYPQYCLSLACKEDDVITHAVIIDPTRREEFTASKGGGAELNGEKMRASSAQNLTDALIANSSHESPDQPYTFQNIATFRELYKHSLTIRRSGCTALDLAYVAAGRLEGFWGHGLGNWDVAAGMLLAEEAGALTSDFEGNPNYLAGDHVLCAAPKCFKPMLQAIKSNFLKKA